MSFPRYEAYKDSGIEWLGQLPAHWGVLPLKRELRFLTSGSRGWAEYYSDEGALFLRIGNLTRSTTSLELSDIQRVDVPAGSEGERTKVSPGDVLFSITAYLGSVAIVPDDLETAYVSQHVALARLRREHFLPAWVANFVLSAAGKANLESQGYGGTKTQLSLEDVANMVLTAPPLREQDEILAFLDRETAKIGALIAEQERLISLLKEKRQAVISHAVTKGLDPDAAVKDSGVEWLGEVPAHWQVMPLRSLAMVVRGASPRPGGDPRFFGGDYIPWVTVAEITKNDENSDLLETEEALTKEGAGYSRIFEAGTVVYTNSGATLGVPKILRISACANDGVVGFENLSPSVDVYFLYHFLSSLTRIIRDMIKQGSGQPNLNTEIVKSLRIALPPIDEQKAIVQRIATIAEDFKSLSAESETGIALLQERRGALLSAAVTGKIDVRGLAPQTAEAA